MANVTELRGGLQAELPERLRVAVMILSLGLLAVLVMLARALDDVWAELETQRAARRRVPPIVVYLTPEDFRRSETSQD